MATSYINAAGGADYTSLTAWWTAVKDSADATETAIVQSDLSGTQICNTAGTNDKAVVIQTDGTRRTITTTAGGAALRVGGTIYTSLTVDGLTLDGDGVQGTFALIANKTTTTITLKDLIVKNSTSRGLDINGACESATLDNCLVYDCTLEAFRFSYGTTAATYNMRHCGAYACPKGLVVGNSANITCNVYNSWILNNSTADIEIYSASTNRIYHSITSDSTGGSANWDTNVNAQTGKTSYASYFTDPASRDFTLLNDDEALWGINSNSTYSPATDITGATRVNDDIGPYEFLSAAPIISSVTLSGTSQIGNTLTATVVTDQDPVDSTAFQWEKASDGSGTGAADISGETSSTLALTYADFGSLLDTAAYVRCGAIATKNSLPSDEAFSAWQQVTVAAGGGFSGSPLKSPFLIA